MLLPDHPTRWARSGRERQGTQSRQGATELVLPGPTLGDVQDEAACFAGEPSGQGEETSPEGLDGRRRLAQTDARGPAGQVVGHYLYGQPSGVWLGSVPTGDGRAPRRI